MRLVALSRHTFCGASPHHKWHHTHLGGGRPPPHCPHYPPHRPPHYPPRPPHHHHHPHHRCQLPAPSCPGRLSAMPASVGSGNMHHRASGLIACSEVNVSRRQFKRCQPGGRALRSEPCMAWAHMLIVASSIIFGQNNVPALPLRRDASGFSGRWWLSGVYSLLILTWLPAMLLRWSGGEL